MAIRNICLFTCGQLRRLRVAAMLETSLYLYKAGGEGEGKVGLAYLYNYLGGVEQATLLNFACRLLSSVPACSSELD